MSLETGTYVADLNVSNPPGSDTKSQGDDHLRLIKTVLQNTFPGANRPFPVPTTLSKSANYTILAADQNKIILCNTGGGSFNLTLPNLAGSDAGWKVSFCRIGGSAPIFILPPSGTLVAGDQNLTSARRHRGGVIFSAWWTGSTWVLERCFDLPIGTIIDHMLGTLPPGFEYANGVALSSSANYPDYFTYTGTLGTNDARGRVIAGADNMGTAGAAGRLTAWAATVGTAGGAQTHTLTAGEMPAHDHGGVTGGPTSNHQHSGTFLTDVTLGVTIVGYNIAGLGVTNLVTDVIIASKPTGNVGNQIGSWGHVINPAGTSTAHANVQPTLVSTKIVLVE